MTRTKIEKFIYSVLDKQSKQVVGSIESAVELKSMKAKTAALTEAGYGANTVAVLTDMECGVYEMPDEQFFQMATRKQ